MDGFVGAAVPSRPRVAEDSDPYNKKILRLLKVKNIIKI